MKCEFCNSKTRLTLDGKMQHEFDIHIWPEYLEKQRLDDFKNRDKIINISNYKDSYNEF